MGRAEVSQASLRESSAQRQHERDFAPPVSQWRPRTEPPVTERGHGGASYLPPPPLPLQDDVRHAHDFRTARSGPRILGPAFGYQTAHTLWCAGVHGRPVALDGHLHNDLQQARAKRQTSVSSESILLALPLTITIQELFKDEHDQTKIWLDWKSLA